MSTENQNVSLYIPHIFPNFSKEYVAKVFEGLNIGKVKNIDFVLKIGKDCKEYNAAYIHFDFWHDTIAANNFKARVVDEKQEARIVYDEPWHWVVLENKARKYLPGERKPRIEINKPTTSDASSVSAPIAPALPFPFSLNEDKKYPTPQAIDINKAPVKPNLKSKYNIKKSMPTLASAPTPVKLSQDFVAEVETEAQELYQEGATNEELEWIYALLEEEEEQLDEIEMLVDEEEQLDEIDSLLEEEDKYLMTIDGRYIQTLEKENRELNERIAQLTQEYTQLESAYKNIEVKSQILVDLIQLLKK